MKQDIRDLMAEVKEQRKEISEIKESVAFMRGQIEGSGIRMGAPITTEQTTMQTVASKQNLITAAFAGLISVITAVLAGHFGVSK